MKLSIAIPVHNGGPAFALTLRYFLEQRREHDLEIIVVDDASDVPVSGLPEGVRLVRHETQQGIARSRNAAARVATGDLLIHTDGHVYFSDHALNIVALVCDGAGIVGVRTQLMHDFREFERRQKRFESEPYYFGWRWSFEGSVAVHPIFTALNPHVFDVPFVGAACLAIRRQLFLDLGGFDEGLLGGGNFEDADLALTAWARGCRVRMLPQVTCFHLSTRDPESDRTGRSPLDAPRYEGSFCNGLRVLWRHLPAEQFQRLSEQIAEQCPVSWAELPAGFISELSAADMPEPVSDACRVRSREWVARRMQGFNE